MTQIVLNIEDDKLKAFMEFIKTLNYVSVSEEEVTPQWQIDEVQIRMQKVDSGEMKTRFWNDAKNEIFKY
jgi:hypothetical protein